MIYDLIMYVMYIYVLQTWFTQQHSEELVLPTGGNEVMEKSSTVTYRKCFRHSTQQWLNLWPV